MPPSILNGPRGTEITARLNSVVLKNRSTADEAIRNSIIALDKIARELAEQDYTGKEADKIARTGAYLAKIVDETVRLIEFLDGNPDSRPDLGIADLLKFLTPDQFSQFQEWVRVGQTREVVVN